jgi:hypothetical protein
MESKIFVLNIDTSGGDFRNAVTPLSDSEAVICGLGFDQGDTISVVQKDGQEFLKCYGYLLRKKVKN